jgi:hypothetical protein
MIYRTTIRIVAMALSIMIAVGPVAAQQRPTPAPPTEAELAAAEAELAAIEEALREAEAEAREAEAEARVAEAEARAKAAEAAAEAAAEEAAQIVRDAEQLIGEPTAAPATPRIGDQFRQPERRRRSAGRTTGGVLMLGVGALFTYAGFEEGVEEISIEDQGTRYIWAGTTLMFWGTLLATVYSDVADDNTVAVNVSPRGVRVSKSFGW